MPKKREHIYRDHMERGEMMDLLRDCKREVASLYNWTERWGRHIEGCNGGEACKCGLSRAQGTALALLTRLSKVP